MCHAHNIEKVIKLGDVLLLGVLSPALPPPPLLAYVMACAAAYHHLPLPLEQLGSVWGERTGVQGKVEILLLVLSLHINMKYPPTTVADERRGQPPLFPLLLLLSLSPTFLGGRPSYHDTRSRNLDKQWTI